MFCPMCGERLMHRDLVRSGDHASGSVEYEVHCPHCMEDIGRISWGEFKLDEDLFSANRERKKEPVIKKDGPLIPPPPEIRPLVKMRKKPKPPAPEPEPQPEQEPPAEEEPSAPKVCPHCGEPLE